MRRGTKSEEKLRVLFFFSGGKNQITAGSSEAESGAP